MRGRRTKYRPFKTGRWLTSELMKLREGHAKLAHLKLEDVLCILA